MQPGTAESLSAGPKESTQNANFSSADLPLYRTSKQEDGAATPLVDTKSTHFANSSTAAHTIASELVLPLPVGGLMSTDEGHRVADAYTSIDRLAKDLGSPLAAPFMTLSFMALLVIPHLKLSDMGLFDGDAFTLL